MTVRASSERLDDLRRVGAIIGTDGSGWREDGGWVEEEGQVSLLRCECQLETTKESSGKVDKLLR